MMLVKKHRLFLVLLFVGACALRGAVYYWYLGHDDRQLQVDSTTYKTLALELAQHNRYAGADGSPNFYRLPGYPLFLSLGYKLFGGNDVTVLWLQILLGALLPCLLFFLVLRLFPHALLLARLASLWMAVHLGYTLYSGFMMSETLCVFFLLCFFLLFMPALRKRLPVHQGTDCEKEKVRLNNRLYYTPAVESLLAMPLYDGVVEYDLQSMAYATDRYHVEHDEYNLVMFFSGVLLGLVGLIRPVGHYMLFISLVLIFMSKKQVRDKWWGGALFLLGWLAPTFPWLMRNFLLTGHIFFHTLPGGHFMYLSAARVVAKEEGISYQQARGVLRDEVKERMDARELILGRPLQEIEVCYEHERVALTWFKKHPFVTARLWMTDVVRTGLSLFSAELCYLEQGRQEIDYFKPSRTLWSAAQRYFLPSGVPIPLRAIIWLEMLMSMFILLGCLLYVRYVVVREPQEREIFIFMALFIVAFIGLGIAGGYARMRLPVEVLMIIMGLRGWLLLALAGKKEV